MSCTAGEGAPLRLELANPQQASVAFGAVSRGSSCSRTLQLVNRGKAALMVGLGPSAELFARLGIVANPVAPVLMRPRDKASFTLMFR
jgi:hypothetical protein